MLLNHRGSGKEMHPGFDSKVVMSVAPEGGRGESDHARKMANVAAMPSGGIGEPVRMVRVLILTADRLYAETIHRIACRVLPEASFDSVRQVSAAVAEVAERPVDLLLTDMEAGDGDVLDFLAVSLGKGKPVCRALVISARREERLLVGLSKLSIAGVFDPASEGSNELEHALQMVISGGRYWSGSVVEYLFRQSTRKDSVCQLLTPIEQLVFAVIGDGCDDVEAGRRLGRKPSAIHSVRRELHRKLGVRHKGELVCMAIQHGFVCFSEAAIVHPGIAILRSACRMPLSDMDSRDKSPVVGP